MRITSKHPVRAELSALPNYHAGIGATIAAVEAVLAKHNIRAEFVGIAGCSGYITLSLYADPDAYVVCDCCAKELDHVAFNECLYFSWYTMQSGRIELTTYIS
jgi:hypothetical protein